MSGIKWFFTGLIDLHAWLAMLIGLIVGAIIFPALHTIAGNPLYSGIKWFRNITQGYWTVITMLTGFIIMLADAMGGINLDAFFGEKAGAKVGATISLLGVFLRYITTTPVGWAKSAVEDVTGLNPAKPGQPAEVVTVAPVAPISPLVPVPVAAPVALTLTPTQQAIANLQDQIRKAATLGDTATVTALTTALNTLQTITPPAAPVTAHADPITP